MASDGDDEDGDDRTRRGRRRHAENEDNVVAGAPEPADFVATPTTRRSGARSFSVPSSSSWRRMTRNTSRRCSRPAEKLSASTVGRARDVVAVSAASKHAVGRTRRAGRSLANTWVAAPASPASGKARRRDRPALKHAAWRRSAAASFSTSSSSTMHLGVKQRRIAGLSLRLDSRDASAPSGEIPGDYPSGASSDNARSPVDVATSPPSSTPNHRQGKRAGILAAAGESVGAGRGRNEDSEEVDSPNLADRRPHPSPAAGNARLHDRTAFKQASSPLVGMSVRVKRDMLVSPPGANSGPYPSGTSNNTRALVADVASSRPSAEPYGQPERTGMLAAAKEIVRTGRVQITIDGSDDSEEGDPPNLADDDHRGPSANPTTNSAGTDTPPDLRRRPGAVSVVPSRPPVATLRDAVVEGNVVSNPSDSDDATDADDIGNVAGTGETGGDEESTGEPRPSGLLAVAVALNDDDVDDEEDDSGCYDYEGNRIGDLRDIDEAMPVGADDETKDEERRPKRYRYLLVALCAIAAVTSIVVVAVVLVPAAGGDDGSRLQANPPSNSPTSYPTANPIIRGKGNTGMPSHEPSSTPSTSPGPTVAVYRAFEDADTLRNAVDSYLRDSSPDTEVARVYGHPIGVWDVSKISDFRDLFSYRRDFAFAEFDGDVSDWNVSNARDVDFMFFGASEFQSDLSRWDVSSVTSAIDMFFDCGAFNADLSRWDVGNLIWADTMFLDAASFNSDISGWDVSNLRSARSMFAGATSFDQNLCDWGDSFNAVASGMFTNTSCPNQTDPAAVGPSSSPSSFCHDCPARR